MPLNVLTKGRIGLIFPLGLAALYLTVTRRLRLIRSLCPLSSSAVFLVLAAPWHLLVAFHNPAVPGSSIARGWFWFYVVNEHFMRFFGKRVPHDYGQVPVGLFLALAALWLAPWASFLPAAVSRFLRTLSGGAPAQREVHHTALILLLWAGIVLFSFASHPGRSITRSLPCRLWRF
jgi:4-amino-4-deoxy-L-arabinose transferase-like glycosyltransferase